MEQNCEYNDDELIPPEWMNEEFLKMIVKSIDEHLTISTFTIRPASGKGDHYASIMFRATIECTRETKETLAKSTLQVIIKTRPPLNTPKGRNLSETQIFENEWKMYTQVIPLLEAEWERYGEKVQFAGRLLYATLHPQPVIVLEDLCLAGYDILRGRLFSLSEVESCLCKLAKWHAVSYKLTTKSSNNNATKAAIATNKNTRGQGNNIITTEKQQVTIVSATKVTATTTPTDALKRTMTNATDGAARNNVLKQMHQGLFKQKSLLRTDYIGGGIRHMIAALENAMMADNDTGADAYRRNSDNSLQVSLMKLRHLEPHIIAACISMNDAFVNGICGPIYVLNHGDFHTTNIMIRRRPLGEASTIQNEQLRQEDIRFIDFQASFFGPMSFDLQYASFTLFSRELRDTKREQLLKYYFEHFIMSLEKLEFNGQMPTYDQFQEDCKRWSCFELFLVATFLPITRLNKKNPHNVYINEIFDSADYRESYYSNPDYLNYVCELLPKYLKAGYLDDFEHV